MKGTSGFTLIELLVTLAVAAIILAIGVPSFEQIIQTNRASAHTNTLVSALTLGRAEAIRRGSTVSLCPSTDQAQCTPTAPRWDSGWIVFADPDGNGRLDGADSLLRGWDGLTGSATLTGPASLSFRAMGEIAPPASGVPVQFRYSLAMAGGLTRLACVNRSGQTRVVKGAASC